MDDAAGISEYGMDPEVSRYVTRPRHRSLNDAVAYLKYAIEAAENGHELTWVITLRSLPDVIGATSLRVQGVHRVELGYALRRLSWGRGFATETAQAVVEWALAQPNIHRVWAVCDAENLASAKVLEKAGMQREGLLRRWAALEDFSRPRDCWSYARVKC
jgi:[ribosomal protein S5]-alanine N-acetyltransferase